MNWTAKNWMKYETTQKLLQKRVCLRIVTALREMSPCFFLAVVTKLKCPQRSVWWWAVAPGSQVFVPSWTLLWEMRLQLWRRKRRVWEASLSGNTVRALEQTMPVSFQGWHKLLCAHLKGWGREKQSLWPIHLYGTEPVFWALWLFEWFSHNHRVLRKFILLTAFTKQTAYGLGQLGSPNCTFRCERRKRGVKTSPLVDPASTAETRKMKCESHFELAQCWHFCSRWIGMRFSWNSF